MPQKTSKSSQGQATSVSPFHIIKRFRVLLAFLGLFIALAAWAVASPVGSSPDDDFHLASIWCGDGIREGICGPGSTEESRMVPSAIAQSICFAYNPNSNATCQQNNLAIRPELFFETERLNTEGLYPSLYYSTMGLLASDHLQISVIAMRLLNIVLFTLLLSLSYLAVSAQFKKPLLITYACTLVPLGFFLIPSTNPSSWSVMSIGAFFFLFASLLQEQNLKKTLFSSALALTAFVMLVGSRGDSALFAVATLAACFVLFFPPKNRRIQFLVLAGVLTIVALIVFFSTGQASVSTEGLTDPSATSSQHSGLNLMLFNLLNLPSLIVGIFGSWGLGWLDTVMPPIVWAVGIVISCIFMFQGLSTTNRKKNIVSIALFSILCAIPLYVLYQSNAAVGALVQPRYIYPLFILLFAVLLVPLDKMVSFSINTSQRNVVFLGLCIAFSLSLHINLGRYISGVSNPTWNLQTAEGWWWNVPVSAFSIWAAGCVGAVIFFWVVFSEFVEKNNRAKSQP